MAKQPMSDVIINNGLFFDGRGTPGATQHLRISDGVLAEVSDTPLTPGADDTVVDADGQWVMPGFIDLHTHYDAEIELNPSLHESLRHGITTVFLGSCSLSTAIGDPIDIADMFTRVEAIPYAYLKPLMTENKTWNTHAEYIEHLESLPLGVNVASFVGYSAVRSHVLGLDRALDADVEPTDEEMRRMEEIVEEGYDAGFLGLSFNTLYWDKMGGDRFRSKCLPSTYASWKEIRRMVRGIRRRDLNLQAVPNISTKYELLVYIAFSLGMFFRKAVKTSLISIMDLRSNRLIWRALLAIGWLANKVLGGKFRYQFLPVAFDLWADGVENVVFEEFGAGAAALHLESLAERAELFKDPEYRAKFNRQWNNPLIPKVFHRNFGKATVMDCPDRSLVGKSFREIGVERGISEVDAFLDLAGEYGNDLRWYTVTGNDRPDPLAKMIASDSSLLGFSDAGAHLRNMAFYNYPLRALKFAKERADQGTPVMPLEKLVYKLTGEIGEWFDIEAGTLEVGKRADLVIVDPSKFDHHLDDIEEAEMPEFGNFKRLVRRNPDVVPAVMVGGELVVRHGEVLPEIGNTTGPGKFLRTRSAPASVNAASGGGVSDHQRLSA